MSLKRDDLEDADPWGKRLEIKQIAWGYSGMERLCFKGWIECHSRFICIALNGYFFELSDGAVSNTQMPLLGEFCKRTSSSYSKRRCEKTGQWFDWWNKGVRVSWLCIVYNEKKRPCSLPSKTPGVITVHLSIPGFLYNGPIFANVNILAWTLFYDIVKYNNVFHFE